MKNYILDNILNFKIKIGTVNSERLCEIIVSNRYLGIMKEEAIVCMWELSRRRVLGDDFGFEKFISNLYDTLPKFKINTDNIFRYSGITGLGNK